MWMMLFMIGVRAQSIHQDDENKPRYPNLCKLALHCLTIPATSVPSEWAFSISGNIVRAKRACLLPEYVQMLVFLVENLP